MPESKTFTIEQIRERWTGYKESMGWRVLREGKWRLYTKKPDLGSGATRSEMVKIKDHMSFPKYLERFNA